MAPKFSNLALQAIKVRGNLERQLAETIERQRVALIALQELFDAEAAKVRNQAQTIAALNLEIRQLKLSSRR